MTKKLLLAIVSMIIGFSLLLTGCKGSSVKVLEDAIGKNKTITYSKQEANVDVGVAGVGINIKALGEVDKKSETSIMKVSITSGVMEEINANMDIYSEKGVMYIKDNAQETYLKMTPENTGEGALNITSYIEQILPKIKDEKSFKDSLNISSNKEKTVTATISPEVLKTILNGVIDSQGVFTTIQSAIEAQLISMADKSAIKATKETITASARDEAKKITEEYRSLFKELTFKNVK
ncbi:MAG: hypothetical protein RR645_02120, partial [Clostridium sp.]